MLVSLPGRVGSAAVPAPTLEAPQQVPAEQAKEASVVKGSPSAVPTKVPVATPPASTTKKVPEAQPVVDRQQQMNQALERLKQKVGKSASPSVTASPSAAPSPLAPSSSNSLTNALAKLQAKVKASGQATTSAPSTTSPTTSPTAKSGGNIAAASRTTGSGSGSGSPASYKAEVASIIQNNWAFSNPMLRGEGMEAYVRIHVLPNGTISQIVFDRRAASEYLNNSIKRALEKSSPLPVIPQEAGGRDMWIGFLFSPEGIER